MNKSATILLILFVSIPVFAGGITVVYKGGGHNLKADAVGGLDSCRSEIKQLFGRSGRLTISRHGFTGRSKATNQRFFYLNGKVDAGDSRKDISFACVTDYRGNKVASLLQNEGAYERTGSTSIALRAPSSSNQEIASASRN